MLKTRTDCDLHWRWYRSGIDEFTGPGDTRWRHVMRRDLRDLPDDEWNSALVMLRRPPTGWLPCPDDVAVVQGLVRGFGAISMSALMMAVRWWANGDPRDFIERAVRDKRAFLVVLVPVGER